MTDTLSEALDSTSFAPPLPDLPTGLASADIELIRDLWPGLTAEEQERLLTETRKLADVRMQLTALQEQRRRREQMRKNRPAIALLDEWLADRSIDPEQAET